MLQQLAKFAFHAAAGNRRFYYKNLEAIAKQTKDQRVLELGSGIKQKDRYNYSAEHLFQDCAKFIQSDINPDFGHKVVDVTKMKFKEEFDAILCLNVLEHVYEYQKAVDNIHRALKPGGLLVIAVPFVFPLHDEPGDFWRFTEHSLRKILKNFTDVSIKPNNSRRLPTGYFAIAKK